MVSCFWTCSAGTSASRSAQCGASTRNARKRAATSDIEMTALSYVLRFDDCDLGCKLALRTASGAYAHALPLAELADPVTPQRLHVDEDVRRVWPARDEAIPLPAVEPLHRCIKCRSFRFRKKARRTLDGRCRWRSGGIVERS